MIWRVDFTLNDGTLPNEVVAEAAIEFLQDAGPFTGLKLVGFTIRRGVEGSLFVTMPAKAWGTGNDRRYFDFVRSIDGDHHKTKKVSDAILAGWRKYVLTVTAAKGR